MFSIILGVKVEENLAAVFDAAGATFAGFMSGVAYMIFGASTRSKRLGDLNKAKMLYDYLGLLFINKESSFSS